MVAIVNNKRIQNIKDNLPKKFFYEKSFDTSFRNKILSEIKLDYSKVDYNNMLACSPLLNREQEYHIFRKYNYLKYRLLKSTSGFEKSKVKPYPKASKPVRLERLGNKSLSEIENIIFQIKKIRNLLLESNLRLIVKQLSKYYKVDSCERDEFFSNGYCHILKAIECFDYRRGFKFSTYCVNILKNNFYRDSAIKRKHDSLLNTPAGEDIIDNREQSYSEFNFDYNKKFIEEMFHKMKQKVKNADVRIKVIKDYYGIDGTRKNLIELAKELNLSKERIRQIKLDALNILSKKISKEVVAYDPLA